MKQIAELYDKHSIILKPLVYEINKNVKSGDTVIDLGCGSGVYIKLLENKVGENGKLIGTDIDNEMIKFCKKNFKKNNLTFRKIPAEKLSNLKAKISLDYANSREKFFRQVVQKNKFKILNWKISPLEKANLKVLLEYFKIPWRSEKLLKIPFSVRYEILKTALIKTFREFPNFKSNRYYLVGLVSKND